MQQVGDLLLAGDIDFEDAIQPNTKFTPLQTCNRLWNKNPIIAQKNCFENPKQRFSFEVNVPEMHDEFRYLPVWKDFQTDAEFQAFAGKVVAEARQLHPEYDPFTLQSWNVIPDHIEVLVLPPGMESFQFRMQYSFADAGTIFSISEDGQCSIMVVISAGVVAKGESYVKSVLAHEFFHVWNDLTANSHIEKKYEESEGHKITAESLRVDLQKLKDSDGDPEQIAKLESYINRVEIYGKTHNPTANAIDKKRGALLAALEAHEELLAYFESLDKLPPYLNGNIGLEQLRSQIAQLRAQFEQIKSQ